MLKEVDQRPVCGRTQASPAKAGEGLELSPVVAEGESASSGCRSVCQNCGKPVRANRAKKAGSDDMGYDNGFSGFFNDTFCEACSPSKARRAWLSQVALAVAVFIALLGIRYVLPKLFS